MMPKYETEEGNIISITDWFSWEDGMDLFDIEERDEFSKIISFLTIRTDENGQGFIRSKVDDIKKLFSDNLKVYDEVDED
jgi:hypothetical protein